jgi:hypothetical protein
MNQSNIRDWGGVPYTNAEADALTQELNDRTASSQTGYNSVDELATKVKAAETNIDAKEDKSSKGVANGYAELGADGKVPAAQLPAGTDEVQEYANLAAFPVTGSSSVIYVALDTNTTYRWGGTVYVEISGGLTLGETDSTAYRGDRGKIAYDHSQSAHAPVDAEANQTNAEIKAQYEANADTNAFTDAWQTKLNQIEDNATADQTGAEIKVAYEAELDTNAYTDAEKSKLAAIEAGATADQTGAEIKAAYEAEADTNAFTDADHSKLDGIEANATADQSDAEIKTAYENNADTNAFTDAEKTKLGTVDTNAEVNSINSTVTGEPTGSDVVLNVVSLTQAEYDAGSPVSTTFYIITDA